MVDSLKAIATQEAPTMDGANIEKCESLAALDICTSAFFTIHLSVDGSSAKICLMKSNGVGAEMRHSNENRISFSIFKMADDS